MEEAEDMRGGGHEGGDVSRGYVMINLHESKSQTEIPTLSLTLTSMAITMIRVSVRIRTLG